MLTLILFLRQLKSILMSIFVNSRISFVLALMKCCFAAFGEQNKIDNDSKCQQVYKSLKKSHRVSRRSGFDNNLFTMENNYNLNLMYVLQTMYTMPAASMIHRMVVQCL